MAEPAPYRLSNYRNHNRRLAPLHPGAALRRERIGAERRVRLGLVLAEIEMESETASVELPPWLGREVTGEGRYYAAHLARHPFGAWQSGEM